MDIARPARRPRADAEPVARHAARLAAMGAEPRLRIVRLLLAAHPQGLVVGEIAAELGIADSTLTHHLATLRRVGLVTVRREGTQRRHMADTAALAALLGFLYAECCTRNQAVDPRSVVCCR
jgi:DNA-binding transcriptional ArsR family regulator